MTMPLIPVALYPLVPNAPGVPAMLRNGAKILDALTFGLLGLGDALDSLIGADPVKWGVFDSKGRPVAVADTIISVEYSNGSRVSNYPVEQGAFATYNKVADPYSARVSMACGGTETQRSDFINALDEAANSIDLYTILTPEKSYFKANIERVDWRRTTTGGAGIVIAELYLVEVRETATGQFSSPASPSAMDAQSQGRVQAAPLDSSIEGFVQ